jgi:hypothetical protein
MDETKRPSRILSNSWYGSLINATQLPSPGRTVRKSITGGLSMFYHSWKHDTVLTTEGAIHPPGLCVLIVLLAFSHQRKLVLLEFLPGRKSGASGAIVRWAYRNFLHRVCVSIQVMTDWEAEDYASRYSLPAELLTHIPFYFVDDRITPSSGVERQGILASGRNSCDWSTLLDAAEGQNWPLTIVCPAEDLPKIEDRAKLVGAKAIANMNRESHDRLLGKSELYILALKETHVSAGHVRLMSALTRKTPLIASATKGVLGYLQLATATVPSGDYLELRRTVNRALEDKAWISERLNRAYELGLQRTFSTYADEVRSLIRG